ncbi:MAG TPA: GNAT family N-acetyltransferase [Longimicrobiaceae bacterium]|jgi:GNAT superfamily N-acetyltransferase|nr:GNAT family N-acetyltransferase [Longimicrobiaceae bacterium]
MPQTLTEPALLADAAWWRIYEGCFPSPEREPREAIVAAMRLGVGAAIREVVDGETVGIATLHVLRAPAVVFCVYLATDPARRGGGVGGALLDHVQHVGEERVRQMGLTPRGLVWEVESVMDAASAEEREMRERRVRWFLARGGRVLPGRYVQPPVDGIHRIPMSLMFRGGGEAPDVASLARAIYREKYGAVNGIPAGVLDEMERGQ